MSCITFQKAQHSYGMEKLYTLASMLVLLTDIILQWTESAMGSKHNKKRFLIVNYSLNRKGTYDELVELSKKSLGPGKLVKSGVVLDLVNEEVLKCEVPGQPNLVDHISFDTLYKHFHKAYGNVLDQFIR